MASYLASKGMTVKDFKWQKKEPSLKVLFVDNRGRKIMTIHVLVLKTILNCKFLG